MALVTWENLKCRCGSSVFMRTYNLSWHETQGTNEKPTGWECGGCRSKVNLPGLIDDLRMGKKRKE